MTVVRQCMYCGQVFEAGAKYDEKGWALLHCPNCGEGIYVKKNDLEENND